MNKIIRVINTNINIIKTGTKKYLQVYYKDSSWDVVMSDKPVILCWSTLHEWGNEQYDDYPFDTGAGPVMYKEIEKNVYEPATE